RLVPKRLGAELGRDALVDLVPRIATPARRVPVRKPLALGLCHLERKLPGLVAMPEDADAVWSAVSHPLDDRVVVWIRGDLHRDGERLAQHSDQLAGRLEDGLVDAAVALLVHLDANRPVVARGRVVRAHGREVGEAQDAAVS